jgi:hypothetical protein
VNFHLTVFGVGIVTLPSDRQFNISRQPQNRLNKDIYNNKTFHVGEITLGASQCAKIYANYQLIYLSNRQLCTIRLHVVSVRVSFFLHSSQHSTQGYYYYLYLNFYIQYRALNKLFLL